MFFERTEEDIISRGLQELANNTNINQLAPGAKTRFLLEATAREQAEQHRIFDENLAQAYIKYADGKFLDFFGDMLNVPRLPSTFAATETDNFMFYVNSGTFGDINNSQSFVIGAGNTVSTVPFEGETVTPGIDEQPIIEFRTLEDVTCQADLSYAYVPIEALVEGSASAVPRNVINRHNFVGYAQNARGTLKCTNRYAISNGTDRESDTAYRYRLINVFKARSMAVLASVRLAALSVPGVVDIKTVNFEQGPGTYSIYVQGLTPTVSPSLLTEVTAAVSSVTALGVRPFVLAPQTLGVEFVAAVSWSPRAKPADISSGYARMRDAVENYINDLTIAQGINMAEVIEVMLAAAPYAMRIGLNKPNTFEEVYVHRLSPTGDATSRSLLQGTDIEPYYNERIILETSGRHRGIQFISF